MDDNNDELVLVMTPTASTSAGSSMIADVDGAPFIPKSDDSPSTTKEQFAAVATTTATAIDTIDTTKLVIPTSSSSSSSTPLPPSRTTSFTSIEKEKMTLHVTPKSASSVSSSSSSSRRRRQQQQPNSIDNVDETSCVSPVGVIRSKDFNETSSNKSISNSISNSSNKSISNSISNRNRNTNVDDDNQNNTSVEKEWDETTMSFSTKKNNNTAANVVKKEDDNHSESQKSVKSLKSLSSKSSSSKQNHQEQQEQHEPVVEEEKEQIGTAISSSSSSQRSSMGGPSFLKRFSSRLSSSASTKNTKTKKTASRTTGTILEEEEIPPEEITTEAAAGSVKSIRTPITTTSSSPNSIHSHISFRSSSGGGGGSTSTSTSSQNKLSQNHGAGADGNENNGSVKSGTHTQNDPHNESSCCSSTILSDLSSVVVQDQVIRVQIGQPSITTSSSLTAVMGMNQDHHDHDQNMNPIFTISIYHLLQRELEMKEIAHLDDIDEKVWDGSTLYRMVTEYSEQKRKGNENGGIISATSSSSSNNKNNYKTKKQLQLQQQQNKDQSMNGTNKDNNNNNNPHVFVLYPERDCHSLTYSTKSTIQYRDPNNCNKMSPIYSKEVTEQTIQNTSSHTVSGLNHHHHHHHRNGDGIIRTVPSTIAVSQQTGTTSPSSTSSGCGSSDLLFFGGGTWYTSNMEYFQTLLQTYYQTGKIHITNNTSTEPGKKQIQAYEILYFLHYYGILYQSNQFIFDSHDDDHMYEQMQQWYNYYDNRSTMYQWIEKYIKEQQQQQQENGEVGIVPNNQKITSDRNDQNNDVITKENIFERVHYQLATSFVNGSNITVPSDHDDGIVGKDTLYLNQHELPVPILLDGIQLQPQSKVTLGVTTGSSSTTATSTNDETMDDPFHNHTIAYDYFNGSCGPFKTDEQTAKDMRQDFVQYVQYYLNESLKNVQLSSTTKTTITMTSDPDSHRMIKPMMQPQWFVHFPVVPITIQKNQLDELTNDTKATREQQQQRLRAVLFLEYGTTDDHYYSYEDDNNNNNTSINKLPKHLVVVHAGGHVEENEEGIEVSSPLLGGGGGRRGITVQEPEPEPEMEMETKSVHTFKSTTSDVQKEGEEDGSLEASPSNVIDFEETSQDDDEDTSVDSVNLGIQRNKYCESLRKKKSDMQPLPPNQVEEEEGVQNNTDGLVVDRDFVQLDTTSSVNMASAPGRIEDLLLDLDHHPKEGADDNEDPKKKDTDRKTKSKFFIPPFVPKRNIGDNKNNNQLATESNTNMKKVPFSTIQTNTHELVSVPSALTAPMYIDDDGLVRNVFVDTDDEDDDNSVTNNKRDQSTSTTGGGKKNSNANILWEWFTGLGVCDVSPNIVSGCFTPSLMTTTKNVDITENEEEEDSTTNTEVNPTTSTQFNRSTKNTRKSKNKYSQQLQNDSMISVEEREVLCLDVEDVDESNYKKKKKNNRTRSQEFEQRDEEYGNESDDDTNEENCFGSSRKSMNHDTRKVVTVQKYHAKLQKLLNEEGNDQNMTTTEGGRFLLVEEDVNKTMNETDDDDDEKDEVLMESEKKEQMNHNKRQLTRNHSMKDILKMKGLRRNGKQKQNDNLLLSSKSAHEPMQSTIKTTIPTTALPNSGVPMKRTTTRRMFGFNRNSGGQQQQEEDRQQNNTSTTKVTTGRPPPVTVVKVSKLKTTYSHEVNSHMDEKTIAQSVATKKIGNKSKSKNKPGIGSLFRRKKLQEEEKYYGNEV